MRLATRTAEIRHFDLRPSRMSHVACRLTFCLSICAGVAARGDTRPSAWLAETRERIASVFAGMEGDFHRERLEMRLEAAERLAAVPERSMLLDAELDEFRSYFDEAFALWKQDPLNQAARPVELNLADFAGADDGETFARAIEAIRALGGKPSVLRVPAGDYLIGSVATGHVIRGLCHLDFGGVTNCAVVGEAPETTRIEFGVYSRVGVNLDGSRNCTVANLDLSWREPPFSQVMIESYDPTNFTAVVRHHLGTLRPDDPRFQSRRKKSQVCVMFDKDGKYLQDRGIAHPFFALKADDLGGGLFRIWFDRLPRWKTQDIRKYHPVPGDVLCIVERGHGEPIHIDQSEFCAFHRVWFHNSPGGTSPSRWARGFTEDHCRVFPKSPDLFLSTNADTFYSPCGSHLAHCEFERMGDDGANCLGEGTEIISRRDARTLVVGRFAGRLRVGDVHRIVHAIDGRFLGDFKVVAFSGDTRISAVSGAGVPRADDADIVITYDRDLPVGLKTAEEAGAMDFATHKEIAHGMRKAKAAADLLFAPLAYGTGFTMRDCRIRDMRGRGAVVQCSNTIIEDCVFENILQGIELAGYTHHMEGTPPHNVVLRHNVIRDCGTGVTSYFSNVNGGVREDEKPIRWITIVSNRFERVAHTFNLRNASDVTIADNVIWE